MKAVWEFDESSLTPWRKVVKDNQHKEGPKRRLKKNVNREGISLKKDEIWRVMLGCQVTSVQRSGPDSLVGKFINGPSQFFRQLRLLKAVDDYVRTGQG